MNRTQQAYYLEKDTFAGNDRFGDLGLGIKQTTGTYTYAITPAATTGGLTAVTGLANPITGTASAVKSYAGGVQIGQVLATSEATTLAVLCEAAKPQATGGVAASATSVTFTAKSVPVCIAGGTFAELKK